MSERLATVLDQARACTHCAEHLPAGPRPIVQADPASRILIASQAPGRIAHGSGVPFRDPSGRRLREWMGLDDTAFYDPRNVAIVPMGFCYPGKAPGRAGGDAPPRPECAPLWRQRILERLTGLRLVLVIGRHAQRWHLGPRAASPIVDLARAWLDAPAAEVPDIVPMPHPSPRNNPWLVRNPWFEEVFVPRLQARVREALAGDA
ncbi:uracil-DNA glycosylase family protein [Halomonas denitrificans]